MNRITSPQELLNELRRLQAACVGGQPSRGKLASELRGLANRVAARVSPSRVLDYIRVFRVKYKSEGVSPSVTEDCQKVYGDAMRIVNDVKDRQWAKIFADRPDEQEWAQQTFEKLKHHPIVEHLEHIQGVTGEGKFQGQTWVSQPASSSFNLHKLYMGAIQTMEDDYNKAVQPLMKKQV